MRFGYLDFSRTFLFFLGIVLHAAYLCVEGHGCYQSVHDVIHSFRMEGFYLIAGFFSGMSLERSPDGVYLRKRILRLGVPFLFGALVLDIVSNCANHWTWSDFGAEFSRNYWVRGDWREHLWFLPTLLVYTGVLVAVRAAWPGMAWWLTRSRFGVGLLVVALGMGYFGAIHVANVIPWQTRLDTFFSISKTEQYAVFFGLGYVLFHRRDLLERIIENVWLNVANVAAYAALNPSLTGEAAYGRYLVQFWHAVFCLSICGLLFYLARRLFSERNPVVRALADASYTVYLVHWPFMIVINRFAIHSGLPAFATLLLLIVSTSVVSYLFHVSVVKRWPLLINLPLPSRPCCDLT
jgi:glucan biosynthesis protein C